MAAPDVEVHDELPAADQYSEFNMANADRQDLAQDQIGRQNTLAATLQTLNNQETAPDPDTTNHNLALLNKHGHLISLSKASSTKSEMAAAFMDLMMLQKQNKINLSQEKFKFIKMEDGTRDL